MDSSACFPALCQHVRNNSFTECTAMSNKVVCMVTHICKVVGVLTSGPFPAPQLKIHTMPSTHISHDQSPGRRFSKMTTVPVEGQNRCWCKEGIAYLVSESGPGVPGSGGRYAPNAGSHPRQIAGQALLAGAPATGLPCP